ncbi:hypothetical protein CCP3SC1AL1_1860001 [Gammaproteobacteria bacterium]
MPGGGPKPCVVIGRVREHSLLVECESIRTCDECVTLAVNHWVAWKKANDSVHIEAVAEVNARLTARAEEAEAKLAGLQQEREDLLEKSRNWSVSARLGAGFPSVSDRTNHANHTNNQQH